jgi:MFS family permease
LSHQEILPSTKTAKPGFYYGYVIVAVVFLMLLVLSGANFCFGVFFKALAEEFGWTRAITAGPYALYLIIQGLLFVVAGRLSDRFGPRIVLTCTGVILGIGYFLMSRVGALWQIYVFYGVILAIGMSGYMLIMSLVSKWFIKERGLMNGIAISGVGAGIMTMPLLASWLITSYDWRTSYIVVGAIATIIIISAAQFLRRNPGQTLLSRDHEAALIESRSHEGGGLAVKEAVRTRQFWLLCIAFFSFGAFFQSIMVHIVPHATDVDIPATAAAIILTIIGGLGIGSRIILGGVADKIGRKIVIIISFAGTTLALAWLVFAGEIWMFYLFAMIFGLFHGGIVVMQSPLYVEMFGLRLHATYLGISGFVYSIGASAFTVLSGYLFDVTNSYMLAFIFLSVLSLIGLIACLFITPLRQKQGINQRQTEAFNH